MVADKNTLIKDLEDEIVRLKERKQKLEEMVKSLQEIRARLD